MKKLYLLILIFLIILPSCAPGTNASPNKVKIAVATQRLGEEYYNAGKYTAALKQLLEAYETIPDDPYLNNSLGLVYLAKERYDLAQESFEKALAIKKDYIHAKNHLGVVYMKKKQWSKAIHCFKEVSENLLYATPEVPLSNLGWAYYHQKLYKTATQYFRKSLKIRPDFIVSIHGLASIYLENGYLYQARDYLERNVAKYPGTAILHADLARVYEAMSDFESAKKSWKAVLNLEPETSQLAQEAQEKLYRRNP